MHKLVKATAAAAILALALVGCSSNSPAETPATTKAAEDATTAPTEDVPATKVSMAIQPWIGYGAWYIAQEKGFFADNNLEVNLIDFEADADMLAALAAGQVDSLNVASHGALLMAEQGVEAKIVLLLDASTSADAILTDGSILGGIAGLEGKQVAFEEGSTSDLLLNYALSEVGLTMDDIVKVPMGAADAGAAMIAGQVPSAVTYEPYITEAVAQGNGVAVLFDAGAKQGLISDVLMVGDAFAAANPEAVTALITAWGQAIDFYNANVDEGRAIIAKGVGADPEELVTAFEGVVFYSVSDNLSQLVNVYGATTLPVVQEVAVAAGLIGGTVQPADVIDASFLP